MDMSVLPGGRWGAGIALVIAGGVSRCCLTRWQSRREATHSHNRRAAAGLDRLGCSPQHESTLDTVAALGGIAHSSPLWGLCHGFADGPTTVQGASGLLGARTAPTTRARVLVAAAAAAGMRHQAGRTHAGMLQETLARARALVDAAKTESDAVTSTALAACAAMSVCDVAVVEFVRMALECEDHCAFWSQLEQSPALFWVYRQLHSSEGQSAPPCPGLCMQRLNEQTDETCEIAGRLQLLLMHFHQAAESYYSQAQIPSDGAGDMTLAAEATLRESLSGAIAQAARIPDTLSDTGAGVVQSVERMIETVGKRHSEICSVVASQNADRKLDWRVLTIASAGAGMAIGIVSYYQNLSSGEFTGVCNDAWESAASFFHLHLLDPVQRIVGQLAAPPAPLGSPQMRRQSEQVLDHLLREWRATHGEAWLARQTPEAAATLSQLPLDELAAAAYKEQATAPVLSMLSGSLAALFLIQKEQMELNVSVDRSSFMVFGWLGL
jgi:hypothetical protein